MIFALDDYKIISMLKISNDHAGCFPTCLLSKMAKVAATSINTYLLNFGVVIDDL